MITDSKGATGLFSMLAHRYHFQRQYFHWLKESADGSRQGTRLHVYRWLEASKARKNADEKHLHSLPELKTQKKWTQKVHPGRLWHCWGVLVILC